MYNPITTYRIQFHKGFTFDDFENIIPYLSSLGIKTVYASPIFEATPGSMHGYDITNPLAINPEIGTLDQLIKISQKLSQLGIGWLQDIVPNHMAYHPNNKWLMDVLEKGSHSEFAAYFDILQNTTTGDNRLMVPFLGSPLNEVIEAGELKIALDGNKAVFDYFGQKYPLNTESYSIILKTAQVEKEHSAPDLTKLFTGAFLKKINSDTGLLQEVADKQYYRLCHWQETDKHINFRRFFTVNGLICLNMQDTKVFDHYHQLIVKLVKDGIFQGLRVDHIDGLYDPATYLQRLRELAGDDVYIIVEKILEQGEKFAASWPVQGSTGYDFLAIINNLFTNTKSEKAFSDFYRSVMPGSKAVEQDILDKKRLILYNYMPGELENLYQLFLNVKLADDNELQHISPGIFEDAIAEMLVHCPVYRFYGNNMPLGDEEGTALNDILKNINNNRPDLVTATAVLENCLLHKPRFGDEDYQLRAFQFYQRLMQFTGPLMAKGVEDTLMYTYNRFVDHNEVGDSPAAFGISVEGFHRLMEDRQQELPMSMNSSSTHDTKRGEGVRAQLNVLSDLSDEWLAQVAQWQKINAKLKTDGSPDLNDEYFIYQTIVGAYPMPGQDQDDFVNRMQEYLEKALREAKVNSNWAVPNEEYEKATKNFVSDLLDTKSQFWKSFTNFQSRIADFGIINSLAQVVLKYTCPGVPDLYQGCEFWDLSLVDPDNRRPVDYVQREKFLSNPGENWQELWRDRYNGRIKLVLTAKLLNERNANAGLLTEGKYVPLQVKGKYSKNVLAFTRQSKTDWMVVAIPLHLASVCGEKNDPTQFDWDDTRIILPNAAPLSWKNQLTGIEGYSPKAIQVDKILQGVPVAILKLQQPKNNRGAGILMHISSLPSPFSIGDLGPQAYAFADFLFESRQKYWQLLPVNPVDKNSGYSPYSSLSVMAGNTLLISPELLCEDGLLTDDDLDKYHQPESSEVDFAKATSIRNTLFNKAYQSFLVQTDAGYKKRFEDFKSAEEYWLSDFALFVALKLKHKGQPWHQWPTKYKSRKRKEIEQFSIDEEVTIEQVKWLQFIFAEQWGDLKKYCSDKGVAFIGDMPFYTSYDSADVWARPELFKLDSQGNMTGIAGVPPDYFSAEGQLWGMPVYRWDNLKTENYDWWVKRIKKNLEYFDLIRLDHFRAFSEYWEVAGGSKNAINGTWQPGPGNDFFEHVKKALNGLPFIAEDLGEITDAVYQLRDNFGLPGMRVLQFAFDDAMPISEHIPHNYNLNSVVYPGTHDNNTIKGWYDNDITDDTKKQITKYLDRKITGKNVAKEMSRLCYSSIAKIAILPMQDILELGKTARMNVPSAADGNWGWMLKDHASPGTLIKYLRKLTVKYNR